MRHSFVVEDPTEPVEYLATAVNLGLDNDTRESNTVILPLPKVWSSGSPISRTDQSNGTGGFLEDGRMLAPVNQTGTTTSEPLGVGPGQTVPCRVESASDFDSWTRGTESGTEADTILAPSDYVWGFSGGSGRSDEGFRAKGTSNAPTPTFIGQEAEFVVSSEASAGTSYTLTCTISNESSKPLGFNEDGIRKDSPRVRTQTLRVSENRAQIKLYRKVSSATSTSAAVYEELDLSKPVGGEVFVGLHVDLGAGQKVTSDKGRVRIHELPDTQNEVDHAENEDRLDFSVRFDDKAGWQKLRQPSGKNRDWWSADTSPASSQHTAQLTQYRYLIEWETFKAKSGNYFNGSSSKTGKLWGHNGQHTISLEYVDDVAGAPIVYSPSAVNQSSASLAKTANVHNLVITDVSTSNGTSDYFVFDKEKADAGFSNPTIIFNIQDEGDQNQYSWKVYIRPTWHP